MSERNGSERVIGAYFAANRARQRVMALLNATFDGLWLGVLDREMLGNLDASFYGSALDHGDDHDYADEAYNRRGLFPWEAEMIREHFPPGCRVVVTGAGGGREVYALAENGYDAVGYEPHPGLVAAGAEMLRRHGHPDSLHVMERDSFPNAGPCDAVLVGWGSYMMTPGRSRRIAFLRGARELLSEGAPILLSFFTRPPDGRHLRTVAGVANAVRRVRRLEPVEVGDQLRPLYAHQFVPEEIEAELSAAGFRMVSYSADPYGHAVGRAE